ncbi:hypothetical protein BDA96_10G205000 [Sorghum bicolor]|uniref:Uncharacterized protein n=2 Tax=Sorghum bicolor TaxID=4558 RepID=A0A921Q498_SORBI|nr:uncharacterized protein LOC110430766 [Sorghum bicolor]KAG0514583.1 hypothetical protein BDA96_10G205000 [Sorghum bicolor]OQU76504.1 hypothetical protein SORBI_3010G156601 [Sorghum bicolor]|eukprot:XP_021304367.1 uncharacterized protein LOC110430766 [Sorghum bicolor]
MAAGSAAKENAAPSASDAAAASAAAASRRHGYHAVKSCGVKKRPSRARLLRRIPLRDITNLIEAVSAVPGPEAPLGQEVSPAVATELTKPDAVLPAVVRLAALQDGDAARPAAKAASYSLRKGFR